MKRDADLTIGEIAQLYRVSLRTLRFYEERGLLAPRRTGQSRYYDEREETRLQLILQAKRMGFSLTEITRFIHESEASPGRPAEAIIVLTPSQIEAQIATLTKKRRATEAAIEELRDALADPAIA